MILVRSLVFPGLVRTATTRVNIANLLLSSSVVPERAYARHVQGVKLLHRFRIADDTVTRAPHPSNLPCDSADIQLPPRSPVLSAAASAAAAVPRGDLQPDV